MELPVLNSQPPAAKGGCSASSCGSTETQVNVLPDHIREKVQNHPCYSEDAHHYFARMHVAVAPACNIQCHYCNRKYDCANESRPGVVSELLERADEAARSRPESLEAIFGLNDGNYRLSPVQAQAILDLRLHRLTGLEQDKIIEEYKVLLGQIDELLRILGDDTRLMEVIREELVAVRDQYGDKRRSEIVQDRLDLSAADLITEEDMVVTMSHEGYVKSQPLTDYRSQRRGGRGKQAAPTKEEDYIEKLIVANTHDTILCFSSIGKVYWLKVYDLPVASRTARGRPFVNLGRLRPIGVVARIAFLAEPNQHNDKPNQRDQHQQQLPT